jgi:hypothetical protein
MFFQTMDSGFRRDDDVVSGFFSLWKRHDSLTWVWMEQLKMDMVDFESRPKRDEAKGHAVACENGKNNRQVVPQ